MSDFHAFVEELLAGLGPIAIKRMFGAAGVYANGVMFALIDEDVLYLKADDALKAAMTAEGSVAWTYSRAAHTREMGYWRVPEAALDDPDEAVRWARAALAVAHAKQAAKPKGRRARARQ